MAQKKLKRFKELKTFKNVFEYPENMQGQWNHYFKNDHPVILELACGKGEYTVGLAALHPNNNYIGIDIKGNRMWAGAKIALEKKYENAAFLRSHIDKIESYFKEGEINEIWITFPDPQLRKSRAKKRLTHPRFLRLYKNILTKEGVIHLKTDSPDLYQFTKQVIEFYQLPLLEDADNVYKNEVVSPELSIQTHYEKLDIAKSNTIFYLRFKLIDTLNNRETDILFKQCLQNLEQTPANEF